MATPVYRTYRFKNKDPEIDRLRTMKKDAKVSDKDIHEASDVATTTLHNWFKGPRAAPRTPP